MNLRAVKTPSLPHVTGLVAGCAVTMGMATMYAYTRATRPGEDGWTGR